MPLVQGRLMTMTLRRVVHVRAAGQVDARVGDVVGAEDQDPRVVRLALGCLGVGHRHFIFLTKSLM